MTAIFATIVLSVGFVLVMYRLAMIEIRLKTLVDAVIEAGKDK